MTNNAKQPSFDESLKSFLENTPSHAPKRDLWQGIEAHIVAQDSSVINPEQKARTQSNGGWVKFASLAASVCFIAWLGYYTPKYLNDVKNQAGSDILVQLEVQHNAQKQALLVSYEDAPSATQDWQSQLRELEDAATAIKQALANDPNNTALLRMLQGVYQQQIDLIESVHVNRWQAI